MDFATLRWLTDDGINLPMINDVPRNAFYDNMLSGSVSGKRCCEVGFGTGLLSMLAIRHGASHITAYEKDPQRFEFGVYMIDRLGLTSKIHLRNEHADRELIDSIDCQVVFHEILHQDIWSEGAWWIRPKNNTKNFLPGTLFFELWAQEFPESAIHGLLQGFDTRDYFHPGVDLDPRFIDLINQAILGDQSKNIRVSVHHDDLITVPWNNIHRDWSWNMTQVFHQSPKTTIGGYAVDYNSVMTHRMDRHGHRAGDLDDHRMRLEIDLSAYRDKNVLIHPRFGIAHAHQRLYLDQCRNWGAEPFWLYTHVQNDLVFEQDFCASGYSLAKHNQ